MASGWKEQNKTIWKHISFIQNLSAPLSMMSVSNLCYCSQYHKVFKPSHFVHNFFVEKSNIV